MPKIIKDAAVGTSQVIQISFPKTKAFTPTYGSIQAVADNEPTEIEQPADLIQKAKEEAKIILSDAEAAAAAIRREAAAQGYSDGKAEGLKAAQEQCQEYLERIAELARRAAIDSESMIRSAEKELAALAMEIAAKVIQREIQTDPTIVLSMVENALGKVGEGHAVRIIVHPEDAELVRSKWSELRGAVVFGNNWEIVGDDRMERGGCIVETRGGLVDSRIETQLAEISNAFEVTP